MLQVCRKEGGREKGREGGMGRKAHVFISFYYFY